MTRTYVYEGQLVTERTRRSAEASRKRQQQASRMRARSFDPYRSSPRGRWDEKGNYRRADGRFAQAPFPIPWRVKASGQKRIVEARRTAALWCQLELMFRQRGYRHTVERPCCGRPSKVLIQHYGTKVNDDGNWMTPEFSIKVTDRVCHPCVFPWSVTIDEDKRRYAVAYPWQGEQAEVPMFLPNLKIEGTAHWTHRESPDDMVLTSTPPVKRG